MTDTIHTVTMTEAEMKAYEEGRKAGLREAADLDFARVLAGGAYDRSMSRDPDWSTRYFLEKGIKSRSDYIYNKWHLHVGDEELIRKSIMDID